MSAVVADPKSQTASKQIPSLEAAVRRGQHIVIRGSSWDDYIAWDARFDELGFGRVSYCDGVLEIMSLTKLHERVRRILSRLIEDYALSLGMILDSTGSATIGERSKDAGKEPDDSFWFDRPGTDNSPDLVTEIVVSSEAISKQPFYARFNIPELWVWENRKITIYLLNENADGYDSAEKSQIFPDLDMDLVEQCCKLETLGEAIKKFQATLG